MRKGHVSGLNVHVAEQLLPGCLPGRNSAEARDPHGLGLYSNPDTQQKRDPGSLCTLLSDGFGVSAGKQKKAPTIVEPESYFLALLLQCGLLYNPNPV